MINKFEEKLNIENENIKQQYTECRLKLLIEIINNEKLMKTQQNSSNYAKLRNIHIDMVTTN